MKLPRYVYHLAEAANWPSIERHGLLPATELIARTGLSEANRERLERSQRLKHEVLQGGVEIRDQRPMPEVALRTCLVGMEPADWYALINARVFFWLTSKRLKGHRAAYASRPQVVLTLDAAALMADYGDRAAVSAINSGSARRKPTPREAATFVPYTQGPVGVGERSCRARPRGAPQVVPTSGTDDHGGDPRRHAICDRHIPARSR